ncbi:MAG: hypothetical protein JXR94_22015 [Candidatus Hydrogenedentes bacterium]|nr:hypothetical protein [Candidatus Hydrogenedentota bacterium]
MSLGECIVRGAGALVCAGLLIAPAPGGSLSESEQLDLLEDADTYAESPGAEDREIIRRYEQVLASVDLAEPIRVEILWKVAAAFERLAFEDPPDKAAAARALQIYRDFIRERPRCDPSAVRARLAVADLYCRMRDWRQAEAECLHLRRFARSLTAEEAERLGRDAHEAAQGGLRGLLSVCDASDDRGAVLERLHREATRDNDEQLLAMLAPRIERYLAAQRAVLDRIVLELMSDAPLGM